MPVVFLAVPPIDWDAVLANGIAGGIVAAMLAVIVGLLTRSLWQPPKTGKIVTNTSTAPPDEAPQPNRVENVVSTAGDLSSAGEAFYEQVANELASGHRRPGLWLKALTEMDGDERRAQAMYVRMRVDELRREHEAPIQVAERPTFTGAAQQAVLAAASQPPVEAPQHAAGERQAAGPVGVGGWLMFFCVCLIILSPLSTVGVLGSEYETLKPSFDSHWAIPIAFACEVMFLGIVCVVGFVLGILISSGRKNGRTLARTYLWARLGLTTAMSIVVVGLSREISPEAVKSVTSTLVPGFITEVGFFLVWYCYFLRSKRVKNTYG